MESRNPNKQGVGGRMFRMYLTLGFNGSSESSLTKSIFMIGIPRHLSASPSLNLECYVVRMVGGVSSGARSRHRR